jgi:hypothetical protein
MCECPNVLDLDCYEMKVTDGWDTMGVCLFSSSPSEGAK